MVMAITYDFKYNSTTFLTEKEMVWLKDFYKKLGVN